MINTLTTNALLHIRPNQQTIPTSDRLTSEIPTQHHEILSNKLQGKSIFNLTSNFTDFQTLDNDLQENKTGRKSILISLVTPTVQQTKSNNPINQQQKNTSKPSQQRTNQRGWRGRGRGGRWGNKATQHLDSSSKQDQST